MDFVIDTTGSSGSDNKPFYNLQSIGTKSNSIVQQLLSEYNESSTIKTTNLIHTYQSDSNDMDFTTNVTGKPTDNTTNTINKKCIKSILNKSVITSDFEKLHVIPPYDVSERKLKEQRRREREKTKGKKWFGLPATEVTDEIKKDLEILQMRSVLDPKHFYKKNDLKVLPKYFQVGKVMDSPLEYYNNRLTRKERKKTLVDELLADADFNKYNKKKYLEIIAEKQKTHYKAHRQAKKLKKKNK